jgi:anti-sigma regulatory factor (Ser/Thr protein kinase)
VVTKTEAGAQIHLLDPDPASVPAARRLACEFAADLLDEKQYKSFELVVTEVVSNAVRHGSAPGDHIRLVITPKDGFICVHCTDLGPGLAPKPGALEVDDDGGFGLFIVEQLTRRWGVTREDNRTRVWFELDYGAAA